MSWKLFLLHLDLKIFGHQYIETGQKSYLRDLRLYKAFKSTSEDGSDKEFEDSCFFGFLLMGKQAKFPEQFSPISR